MSVKTKDELKTDVTNQIIAKTVPYSISKFNVGNRMIDIIDSMAVSAQGLTITEVKTADYAAVAGEFVRVDTSGGDINVNLPLDSAEGDQVGVILVKNGGGNCFINAQGDDEFTFVGSGFETKYLTTPESMFVFQYVAEDSVWIPVTQFQAFV